MHARRYASHTSPHTVTAQCSGVGEAVRKRARLFTPRDRNPGRAWKFMDALRAGVRIAAAPSEAGGSAEAGCVLGGEPHQKRGLPRWQGGGGGFAGQRRLRDGAGRLSDASSRTVPWVDAGGAVSERGVHLCPSVSAGRIIWVVPSRGRPMGCNRTGQFHRAGCAI